MSMEEDWGVSDENDRLLSISDSSYNCFVSSPQPVGSYCIGDSFQIMLLEKPSQKHIDNHKEMLGWIWKDYD